MSLKPSVVSPASMMNLRPRNEGGPVRKMMVIDCRHDTHWNAIHDPQVNGVVLRRRPIRAMETYFDQADDAVFQPCEFTCAQSRLRSELQNRLVLASEDEEIRRKFLINDIANWARIFISQAKSREYLVRICSDLPSEFQSDAGALKMIMAYRGPDIAFRQPSDKDERTFSPYGVALFRGRGYETGVEWCAQGGDVDKPFYLTMEPYSKRMR